MDSKIDKADDQPDAKGGTIRPLLWYWMFGLLLFMLSQSVFELMTTSPLAYSEFKQLLHGGLVREVTVSDTMVTGTLKDHGLDAVLPKLRADAIKCGADGNCPFTTLRVDDPGLVKELEAAQVRYVGKQRGEWLSTLLVWVLPMLLLFWAWGRMLGGGGTAAAPFGIARGGARVHMQSRTGVGFGDVAGADEARDALLDVVECLKNPQRCRHLGAGIPKGMLIVGPPGTGKTLLARAAAGEAGVPLLTVFAGAGARAVRELFAQARKAAPCIVCIDAVEALGRKSLHQLLAGMDGAAGIIVLGATSRPDMVDPALLRPGRLEHQVALDLPDLRARQHILQVLVRKVPLATDVDLGRIAARTTGLSGAGLAGLVNEAALLALRRGKERIDRGDFDGAIGRLAAKPGERPRTIHPVEKETLAFHEAGRALVAEFRRHADPVGKIAIIPGCTATAGDEAPPTLAGRHLLRKSELLDRIDVCLGGRVAEEMVFGDVSTAATSDLETATDLARRMVTQYGMGEQPGLATSGRGGARECSEHTARTIDAGIARLLDEARQRVLATLGERRELLDALAQALLERETVDRDALDALLRMEQTAAFPRELAKRQG